MTPGPGRQLAAAVQRSDKAARDDGAPAPQPISPRTLAAMPLANRKQEPPPQKPEEPEKPEKPAPPAAAPDAEELDDVADIPAKGPLASPPRRNTPFPPPSPGFADDGESPPAAEEKTGKCAQQ